MEENNNQRLDDIITEDDVAEAARQTSRRRRRLIGIIAAVVVALAVIIYLVVQLSSSKSEAAQKDEQIEQLKLENEMIQSANEFRELDQQYSQLESNQINLLSNDSIVEKYAAAKAQVEKLLNELKNEKNKSAAQISKLKAEIETLKGILRDYTQMIADLKAENEGLRVENESVKDQNRQLTQHVDQVERANEQLNQRMTLAEKLNVTGVNLTPLNKKGKSEKNITKAQRLMVTFTVPQNNSTPAGEKTIYLRITNPEGDLLGNGGNFTFEGASVASTARRTIEYANEEIGGVTIYWDVNTTLNPGTYTVELFSDGYRLARPSTFTLKK